MKRTKPGLKKISRSTEIGTTVLLLPPTIGADATGEVGEQNLKQQPVRRGSGLGRISVNAKSN
jgi:hypothetical protein